MTDSIFPPEKIRKRQFVVAIGALLVLFVGVFGTLLVTDPAMRVGRPAEREWQKDYRTPGNAVDPQRAWIASSEAEMDQLKTRMTSQDERVERELGDMRRLFESLLQEQRKMQAVRTIAPEASRVRSGSVLPEPSAPARPAGSTPKPAKERHVYPKGAAGPAQPMRSDSATVPTAVPRQRAGIVKVVFSTPSSTEPSAHIRDTIPAGSFGKAVLLTGLDAPTGGRAQSDPHPVLLQLVENGNLPNRYRHRVRECRMVAAGYGNLSDERAYLRLEKLSCVLRNGEIVSRPVKGYVSGEDGKIGLRGELLSKQGAMIARSFLAGMFGGIGNGIAQTYSQVSTSAQGAVQTIDPDRIFEHGASTGVSTSLEKIADWYLERAEDVFPVIAIDGGRTVEVTLTDDVKLGANLLERFTPADEMFR